MNTRRTSRLAALDRLAAAERAFAEREFLAPVAGEGSVNVRIAGVVCRLKIQPREFVGWGVFRARDASRADLTRPAKLAERAKYLALFPAVRVLILSQSKACTLIGAAHDGDRRIRWADPLPLLLAEDVQLFDTIVARFDGARFWFDAADPARDPTVAAYLRERLPRMTPPAQLDRAGLTPEERRAYAAHFELQAAELAAAEAAERDRLRDRAEFRLRRALAHAGADLRDYRELADGYQIRYTVDGAEHVSLVSKADLTVQSAGICLSGEDAKFDLESLVGVLRETEY